MYRPTDRQRALFPAALGLTDSQKRRLKDSWATHFAERVFPLLLSAEAEFADLYHEDNGRPNWGLARMLGLLLLQELNDLHDQAALDALSFDARWQHALDIDVADAYLSRRSYVDFRVRLLQADPELERVRGLFDQIRDAGIADLSICTAQQRLDSTHIVSNVRIRGRFDLFSKTLRHFLNGLRAGDPTLYAALPDGLRAWAERDHDGWFALADATARRTALDQVVGWCVELVLRFESDPAIAQTERFLLLSRLVHEQCEGFRDVIETTLKPPVARASDGDEDEVPSKARTANQRKRQRKAGRGSKSAKKATKSKKACKAREITTEQGRTVTLKHPKEIGGHSLQSPHDPGAGCGHKGPGYSVQIAETCHNDGTELITDYDVQPANLSDHGQAALAHRRLDADGIAPEEFYVDSGYVSGAALLDAIGNDYELTGPARGSRLPSDYIGRDDFEIDRSTNTVLRCPQGHPPTRHGLRISANSNSPEPIRHAYFDGATCRECPLLGRCAVRKPNNGKKGSFHLEVLPGLIERDRALVRQKEPGWWKRYAIRGGIEATNSELKRSHGLGRLRVRGAARVRLAVAMKLMACNVKRWARAAADATQPHLRPLRGPWTAAAAVISQIGAATGRPVAVQMAAA